MEIVRLSNKSQNERLRLGRANARPFERRLYAQEIMLTIESIIRQLFEKHDTFPISVVFNAFEQFNEIELSAAELFNDLISDDHGKIPFVFVKDKRKVCFHNPDVFPYPSAPISLSSEDLAIELIKQLNGT